MTGLSLVVAWTASLPGSLAWMLNGFGACSDCSPGWSGLSLGQRAGAGWNSS